MKASPYSPHSEASAAHRQPADSQFTCILSNLQLERECRNAGVRERQMGGRQPLLSAVVAVVMMQRCHCCLSSPCSLTFSPSLTPAVPPPLLNPISLLFLLPCSLLSSISFLPLSLLSCLPYLCILSVHFLPPPFGLLV